MIISTINSRNVDNGAWGRGLFLPAGEWWVFLGLSVATRLIALASFVVGE